MFMIDNFSSIISHLWKLEGVHVTYMNESKERISYKPHHDNVLSIVVNATIMFDVWLYVQYWYIILTSENVTCDSLWTMKWLSLWQLSDKQFMILF